MAKHYSSNAYLPEEILLTEIFPRLPVKDVGRCRCLSKEWCTKLSTFQFVHMHLKRKINRHENTLLLETWGTKEAVLCTMPSRTPNNNFLSKRIDLRFRYKGFEIENTCHGLVLLHNKIYSEMLLVNPVTRQQLSIPNSPLRKNNTLMICPALGYDSSTMDYKIAYLDDSSYKNPPFVHVYSVKMSVWKRYDFPICGATLFSSPRPWKVVLNGIIHWLLCIRLFIEPGNTVFRDVICSFDLAGEVFGDIPLPGGKGDMFVSFSDSTRLESYGSMFVPQVLGERFSILNALYDYEGEFTVTNLWVMKEYGVTSSWAKVASWQLPENEEGSFGYEPVCLNGGDEEIVMRTYAGAFVVYNLKENNAVEMVVDGSNGPFSAGHAFVESLVSPFPAALAN